MSRPKRTRLSITWSKDTELALRSHLGALARKKGALSKFVEDAVKWRLFSLTVEEAREGFANLPADEVSSVIEDALARIRSGKRQEHKPHSRK